MNRISVGLFRNQTMNAMGAAASCAGAYTYINCVHLYMCIMFYYKYTVHIYIYIYIYIMFAYA